MFVSTHLSLEAAVGDGGERDVGGQRERGRLLLSLFALGCASSEEERENKLESYHATKNSLSSLTSRWRPSLQFPTNSWFQPGRLDGAGRAPSAADDVTQRSLTDLDERERERGGVEIGDLII